MKKSKPSVPQYSPLSKHKKEKGKLLSPMHDLNMIPVDWERDLLPEHLWIELLSSVYIPRTWLDLYHSFLDALDPYSPGIPELVGYISDFGRIPAPSREEFLSKHSNLIYRAFHVPLGRILTLYPEAPCYWLLQKERLDIEKPVDPAGELDKLSKAVVRLMPGKDDHAGHIRAIPFSRLLKQGKVHLTRDMGVIELLPKYPCDCTDEEKYHVQSFARNVMNIMYLHNDFYKSSGWPKYFWRRNFELVKCAPHRLRMDKTETFNEADLESFIERLRANIEIVLDYLGQVSSSHRYDIYDSDKDDSLLGLFSRLTRLYVAFFASPHLWARDLAGIFIRCIADTAITFSYLCKKGTADDFKKFKAYGEGKEKLLMLHLQDTYPERSSFDGMKYEDIAKERGWSFTPELLDIELSNWTDKSARDLASGCGLEDIYRLVYDPASSEVHGTWISLEKTNFVRCSQPLHRFHRLPEFIDPPIAIDALTVAQDLYMKAQNNGKEFLQFPDMNAELKSVEFLMANTATEDSKGNDEE